MYVTVSNGTYLTGMATVVRPAYTRSWEPGRVSRYYSLVES